MQVLGQAGLPHLAASQHRGASNDCQCRCCLADICVVDRHFIHNQGSFINSFTSCRPFQDLHPFPARLQVGAGTMNPATFLRVQGPEPWAVAYPEPSIRPDDSRYGDNPNRLQRHTQFQVCRGVGMSLSLSLSLSWLHLGCEQQNHAINHHNYQS